MTMSGREKTSWKATFWAGGERCIQTGKMWHIYLGGFAVPEDGWSRVSGDLTSERHLTIDADLLVTRCHDERRRRCQTSKANIITKTHHVSGVMLNDIIALHGTPSQRYTECHFSLADGITVLPDPTRHKWTHPAVAPAKQAGTRLIYPGGTEGWVVLGDWLHTWYDLSTHRRSPRHPPKYKPDSERPGVECGPSKWYVIRADYAYRLQQMGKESGGNIWNNR